MVEKIEGELTEESLKKALNHCYITDKGWCGLLVTLNEWKQLERMGKVSVENNEIDTIPIVVLS